MLSLQDCLDFSDLCEDEVDVIAEHEHLPAVIAAELGNTLMKTTAGVCLMKLYILESLEKARERGQFDKALHLDSVLQRFDATHPGAAIQ